jgi:hypothetical protein
VCGQHHASAAFTPGKDPVPIVQEAGWAPEPVWIGAENLAPPGFDPRPFQPLASRYTDYAIPARNLFIHPYEKCGINFYGDGRRYRSRQRNKMKAMH